MSRNKRPRKAYRPRAANANAHLNAMIAVRKLTADEVKQGTEAMDLAFVNFEAGNDCPFQWRVLADAFNVAEDLSAIGICSDAASRQTVHEAQLALFRLQQQHKVLGTWAMWEQDRAALVAGLDLHRLQLSLCDYAEYRRAVENLLRRLKAARHGAAPKGALVVAGDIGTRPVEVA